MNYVILAIAGLVGYLIIKGKSGLSGSPNGAGSLTPTATQLAVSSGGGIGGSQALGSVESTAANSALKSTVTDLGLAGASGSSIGLAGGLALGAETAGIAALAVLAAVGIGNLSRCGTITSIGCTKRGDEQLTEECYGHARQIYQAFLDGAIDAKTALAGISQLASEANTYMTRKTDYTNAPPGPCYECGNFSSYDPTAQQGLGNPANLDPSSPAYQAFCNMPSKSLEFILTQGFPSLINAGRNGYAQFPQYFNTGSLAGAIAANASKGI